MLYTILIIVVLSLFIEVLWKPRINRVKDTYWSKDWTWLYFLWYNRRGFDTRDRESIRIL